MPLNLSPASGPRSNRPFKSAGEDQILVQADAQMTDTTMIFHASGEQTNGSCAIGEIIWRAPDASLHHIHTLEDEGFYVIEGSMTLHGPDGDLELGPGEFGWAPRGVSHGYTIGPNGARALVIFTPGTQLGEFFRKVAALQESLLAPGAFEEFNAWSGEHYGLTFLDPATAPPGSLVGQPSAAA